MNKHMASIEERSLSKIAFHIKASCVVCLRNSCSTQISNSMQSNFVKSHFFLNSAPRRLKRDHSAGTEVVLIFARLHDWKEPRVLERSDHSRW